MWGIIKPMEYKIFLGYLAVGIEIVSYSIYFWSIYRGEAKPHAFTWFVWGVLGAISFPAVLSAGGGAGAWVLGINAVLCLTIAGIGWYQKHIEYDRADWIALGIALLGAILWWRTSNPLYAVILVSISDAIAFSITIRKAYKLPFEENYSSFLVGGVYYILAIIALESYSLTTWLYYVVIILFDLILVGVIITRRKKLS